MNDELGIVVKVYYVNLKSPLCHWTKLSKCTKTFPRKLKIFYVNAQRYLNLQLGIHAWIMMTVIEIFYLIFFLFWIFPKFHEHIPVKISVSNITKEFSIWMMHDYSLEVSTSLQETKNISNFLEIWKTWNDSWLLWTNSFKKTVNSVHTVRFFKSTIYFHIQRWIK